MLLPCPVEEAITSIVNIFIKPRPRTNAIAFIIHTRKPGLSFLESHIEFHLASPHQDTFLDWVPSYRFSLLRASQYHQPFRLDLFSGYISSQDFPHDLLKTWQSSTCKRMNNFSLLHYLCEIVNKMQSCTDSPNVFCAIIGRKLLFQIWVYLTSVLAIYMTLFKPNKFILCWKFSLYKV